MKMFASVLAIGEMPEDGRIPNVVPFFLKKISSDKPQN